MTLIGPEPAPVVGKPLGNDQEVDVIVFPPPIVEVEVYAVVAGALHAFVTELEKLFTGTDSTTTVNASRLLTQDVTGSV